MELGCARLVRFPDPLWSRKWLREVREGRTGGVGAVVCLWDKRNRTLFSWTSILAAAIGLPVIFIYGRTEKHKCRRNISTTLYLFHQVAVFSSPDTFPLLNSQKPAGSTLYVCLFTYEDLEALYYVYDWFRPCSCIGTTELSIPTLSWVQPEFCFLHTPLPLPTRPVGLMVRDSGAGNQ